MADLCNRLFAERRRLNLNQTDMGKLGGVTLNTYGSYESGKRVPDAACLASLHAAGVDVYYLLTGSRSNGALSQEETQLLEGFNRMDERGKSIVQAVVQTYNTSR